MRSMIRGGLATVAMLAATVVWAQDGPPVIQSWGPQSGLTGSIVTIKGGRLGQVTGVSFFNGKQATIQKPDSSTITMTVPTGATTGPVKLTTTVNGTVTLSPDFVVTGEGGTTGTTGGGGGTTGGGGFINPPHITPPAGAMTGHPRIFLTAADVPKYRAWAVATNPVWNSLKAAATTGKQNMDNHLVPDQDEGNGAGNYSPYPSEQYAELFAFMSLIDPNAANRTDYANRAHDLIMYVFNIAAQGVGTNADPFRMPQWSVYNRSRWFGEAFPCVVDWCYQTFSPADKATIRKVFTRWIQENLKASVTANEHPQPLGVINSPQLIANRTQVRWAANNYYCNHARQIGLMSLALDPADDVPLGAGDPPAGTIRDFIGNAIGAWLFQVEDCETKDIAGGMSPEGMGYGESDQSAIAMLLLGMQTSGVDNSAVYGPQAAMASGPFWSHDILDGYTHSMSPKKVTQYNWIGPSNLPADYGDVQGYQVYNMIRVWGPIALMARARNDQATYDKARWMIDQFEPGTGASRNYQLSTCLSNYGPLIPIFYFMACDPTEAAKPDPRSGIPLDYFGTGLGRLLSRTDWTPNASWFTFKASWNRTDHNPADAGKIEFYRKGEWLTKGRQGYGFNVNAVDLQNSISIENPLNTNNWFWVDQAAHGGQYSYSSAGDPVVQHSAAADFAYVQADTTNLYNLPSANMNDVAHASRSVIWLKPDVIVTYDRIESKTANRYKRVYLNTQNLATVSGKVATATTPGGQKLVLQCVLPKTAKVKAQAVPSGPNGVDKNETVQGELMFNRIMVEDQNRPQSCRYLNLIQGMDGAATPLTATVIASIAGDAFDGATFGNVSVVFRRDLTVPFTTTTFRTPLAGTAVYITGLTPGATYTVKKLTQSTYKWTITPGPGLTADAGGVLKL